MTTRPKEAHMYEGQGSATGTIAKELTTDWQLKRFHHPESIEERPSVTSPEVGVMVLAPHFFGLDREHCIALLLDTKHRLLTTVTVSIGSIDHTFMTPRDIFRDALLANASAIVVAHNHPSGDPEPSRDDEAVTMRLARAGKMIGVELLDHLVFGGERWVSLARRGVL